MPVEQALGFLRSIVQGRAPAPIILIAGPQAFLREYVLDSLRRGLSREGFQYRSFQVGAGSNFAELLNELGEADLFAPKRLLACRVLRSHRERGGDASEEAARPVGADEPALAEAVEQGRIAPHLALIYDRDAAPARIRRAVERGGVVVNCLRPFDNQIVQYAEIFARGRGLKVSAAALDLLVSRHGADLGAIANSIARAAIHCAEGKAIDAADLAEAGSRRAPEIFELAESVARGGLSAALALYERALETGRDPTELLAVEIIPLVRRMLVAASMLAAGKGSAEIARTLGMPPQSALVTRAIEGARRFGLKRLDQAHARASDLDASIKMGLVRERGQAVAALLMELLAVPER